MRIKKRYLIISLVTLLAIFLLMAFLTGPNFIFGNVIMKTSDKAVIQSVSNSLDGFYKSNGVYPDEKIGLNALLCDIPNNSHKDYCLPYFPLDHLANKLHYKYPGSHNPASYDIWIENKDDGVIGNW